MSYAMFFSFLKRGLNADLTDFCYFFIIDNYIYLLLKHLQYIAIQFSISFSVILEK